MKMAGNTIDDFSLIDEIENFSEMTICKLHEINEKLNSNSNLPEYFDHPLDKEVIELLKKIKPSENESISYKQEKDLDELWSILIDKAVKNLRIFDTREPFLANSKKAPIAYGLNTLTKYHEKYTDFEGLLYGGSPYYRDHIFHAIRTWMLGIFCLLSTDICEDGIPLIDRISIDGEKDGTLPFSMNFFEKISMWTIAALCHDLGYPLEKSQQILDKTNNMMSEFIPNSCTWNNYAFTGVQDNINDYIIKFISSKMKDRDLEVEETKESIKEDNDSIFYGRVQPKYYLKYSKSLEKFNHGIISSVIVYKMLLYFIEADFNLNDDYLFNQEEARQFYIRREILRAMASHTCFDIYNMKVTTLSSLLFICDELQEWGRKSWQDLYVGGMPDKVKLTINEFSENHIKTIENIDFNSFSSNTIAQYITRIIKKQYEIYKLVFRDGQYTNARNFDLEKTMHITLPKSGSKNRSIDIRYGIMSKSNDYFKIYLEDIGFSINSSQYKEIFKAIEDSCKKGALYEKEIVILPEDDKNRER